MYVCYIAPPTIRSTLPCYGLLIASLPMDSPWVPYRIPMLSLWFPQGFILEFPYGSPQHPPMVYAWNPSAFPVDGLWVWHKCPILDKKDGGKRRTKRSGGKDGQMKDGPEKDGQGKRRTDIKRRIEWPGAQAAKGKSPFASSENKTDKKGMAGKD